MQQFLFVIYAYYTILLFLFLFHKFMCHFTKHRHHTITNMVVFSKASSWSSSKQILRLKDGTVSCNIVNEETTKKISLYNLCRKIYNER